MSIIAIKNSSCLRIGQTLPLLERENSLTISQKKKEKRKKNGELKEILCNFNNNVLSSTICMMILNYSLFYSLILHIFKVVSMPFPNITLHYIRKGTKYLVVYLSKDSFAVHTSFLILVHNCFLISPFIILYS